MSSIRLTQYSHGAGCGCKIAPSVLSEILATNEVFPDNAKLIVGNNSRDDAAVYDLGDGRGLISTTDFFMPIVDDPYEFGRIASANAISDVYAMGGTPLLAIAILGWPLEKLPPEVAREVVSGSRSMCAEAGIPLAGGHSIDSPEPIFGLAVNGTVALNHLKRNDTAAAGDVLFLTKPIGIGILTTAEKKGILRPEDKGLAARWMMTLNRAGEKVSALAGVHAMTDVTGFGLLGHLTEMCEGSNCSAVIDEGAVMLLDNVDAYVAEKAVPGGTMRNFKSYGHLVAPMNDRTRALFCDPQTSGGLLIAAAPEAADAVAGILRECNTTVMRIGTIGSPAGDVRVRFI
ncbi:MAG: selenide, water dikinase SelD [Spirochaetes bacterium]|nr:selenide, water dikinase SelD [Spirochaetota bacterium]